MKIRTIWVREHGEIWLEDALDEDTIESGVSFEERLAKVSEDHVPLDIRVVDIEVPWESIEQAFEIPQVRGEVERG